MDELPNIAEKIRSFFFWFLSENQRVVIQKSKGTRFHCDHKHAHLSIVVVKFGFFGTQGSRERKRDQDLIFRLRTQKGGQCDYKRDSLLKTFSSSSAGLCAFIQQLQLQGYLSSNLALYSKSVQQTALKTRKNRANRLMAYLSILNRIS